MTTSLEAAVQEIQDRQEIYSCLVRYCSGVDRMDLEELASAYHPDAIDDHGSFCGPVANFIEWAVYMTYEFCVACTHSLCNHKVEFDNETSAHAETYFIFNSNSKEGVRFNTTGRYLDRFEKRNGRWGIAARICVIDVDDIQPNDRGGDPDEKIGGDAGLYRKTGRGDRSDPRYLRPITIDPSRLRPFIMPDSFVPPRNLVWPKIVTNRQ